ncbi:MAG: hypothetical protein P8I82_05665 [Flavobacteriales bacterium]|nr:hypothetical protein [Flavobacteriales bacterium]
MNKGGVKPNSFKLWRRKVHSGNK